jgi:DNA-binding response OmpR family regulator
MSQNQPPKILIVDDDDVSRIAASRALQREKYVCIDVNNGFAALDIATSEKIDLIVLDIMMPTMDGLETCRKLKADERSRDIPVIFLTALGSNDNIVNGFAQGGADYIVKPLVVKELRARVKIHLEQRRMRKTLQQLAQQIAHYQQTPPDDCQAMLTELACLLADKAPDPGRCPGL